MLVGFPKALDQLAELSVKAPPVRCVLQQPSRLDQQLIGTGHVLILVLQCNKLSGKQSQLLRKI